MDKPRIFVDFHNADTQGRLRLNCRGTVQDLAHQQISLQDGLQLELYNDDLETEGQVCFSDEENLWVAIIDWDKIRREETVQSAFSIKSFHEK